MKQLRRTLRPAGKTAQAILRWKRFSFNDAPPVFGNSKPKSGSHLLLQILNGFTQIMPYRYVDADPIRTIKKDGGRRTVDGVAADLRVVPSGVIGWGYVEASPENVAVLCQPNRVNYFIYRDPRDMLVSQVFFATDMHEEHGMHEYYKSLPDFAARLNVAITGIDRDGLKMVSVKQRYEGVFQWLQQKNVMNIRFEDLINNRDVTLNAMLDEVEKRAIRFQLRAKRRCPFWWTRSSRKRVTPSALAKLAAGGNTSARNIKHYSKMSQGIYWSNWGMRRIMIGEN